MIEVCQKAGTESSLISNEIQFQEHSVNGKSKGICFISFKEIEDSENTKEFLNSQYF